jgi:putative redox protein
VKAVATWAGGYRAECDIRDFRLMADETSEYGGSDTGPMPTELLVGSLATCFALAVAHAAKKRDVELPDLTVRAESFRAEGEARYERFVVEVESSYGEGLERLVEAAKRYCFVSSTLIRGAEIEYRSRSR